MREEEDRGGVGRQRPGLAFISVAPLLESNPYPPTGRVYRRHPRWVPSLILPIVRPSPPPLPVVVLYISPPPLPIDPQVGAMIILPIVQSVGEAMPGQAHPKLLVMATALMCSGGREG